MSKKNNLSTAYFRKTFDFPPPAGPTIKILRNNNYGKYNTCMIYCVSLNIILYSFLFKVLLISILLYKYN